MSGAPGLDANLCRIPRVISSSTSSKKLSLGLRLVGALSKGGLGSAIVPSIGELGSPVNEGTSNGASNVLAPLL